MKNFEKNIKNKADDFQMDPMPDSFDKVMAALEKKKKRRFIFWLWFLIPGLAIGGSIGLYHAFSDTNKSTLAHEQKQAVVTTNESSDKNISGIKNSEEQTTSNKHSATTGVVENKTTNVNKGGIQKNTTTSKKNNSNNLVSNTTMMNTVESSDHQTENNHDPMITRTDNHINDSRNYIEPFREKQSFIIRSKLSWAPMFSVSGSPLFFKQQSIPTVQSSPLVYIKPRFSKFSLGIYSDLGVSKSSFYTTVPVDSTPKGYYTTARSSADKFVFSYSAGIQFRYSPIRFFSIETGIAFTHYESYQVIANGGMTTTSVMDLNEPDTVLSFASLNNSPALKEYYNTYDYISIPLKFYYQNRWKWIGIEAGGGVVFDIPVNTKSYAADENTGESYLKKDVEGSRLNRFGIQAVGNVNVVFHVGHFGLFAGPTFKYRLNSMFDDQYIMQQRPYFIGGQIGVRYNF